MKSSSPCATFCPRLRDTIASPGLTDSMYLGILYHVVPSDQDWPGWKFATCSMVGIWVKNLQLFLQPLQSSYGWVLTHRWHFFAAMFFFSSTFGSLPFAKLTVFFFFAPLFSFFFPCFLLEQWIELSLPCREIIITQSSFFIRFCGSLN